MKKKELKKKIKKQEVFYHKLIKELRRVDKQCIDLKTERDELSKERGILFSECMARGVDMNALLGDPRDK